MSLLDLYIEPRHHCGSVTERGSGPAGGGDRARPAGKGENWWYQDKAAPSGGKGDQWWYQGKASGSKRGGAAESGGSRSPVGGGAENRDPGREAKAQKASGLDNK